jgi:hypothetical protein
MWVKTGKAQGEHMFSAVHPIADIIKLERHVRKVPTCGINPLDECSGA